jgi:hypothetical protein
VTDRLECDVGHDVKLDADAKRCKIQMEWMGFDDATGARRPDIYTGRQPQNSGAEQWDRNNGINLKPQRHNHDTSSI